jgi:hypothetical protein
VLLGLLGAQVVAVFVACLLRCCTRNRSYEEFREDEQAEYETRRDAAAEQLGQLKSKLGLQAAAAGSAGGADGKRVIAISAVSGTAADRAGSRRGAQQQAAVAAQQQQQRSMRSSLFQRSDFQEDDGKLEAEMEAGKISSRWVAGWQGWVGGRGGWAAGWVTGVGGWGCRG